jgi:hypothetical protein
MLQNVPHTLVEVVAKESEINTSLFLCQKEANSGFRGFNALNQGRVSNGNPDKKWTEKWCRYHKVGTHNSKECSNKDVNKVVPRTGQNTLAGPRNSNNRQWCNFCESDTCFKKDCYKLQKKMKNKSVPNTKNIQMNNL